MTDASSRSGGMHRAASSVNGDPALKPKAAHSSRRNSDASVGKTGTPIQSAPRPISVKRHATPVRSASRSSTSSNKRSGGVAPLGGQADPPVLSDTLAQDGQETANKTTLRPGPLRRQSTYEERGESAVDDIGFVKFARGPWGALAVRYMQSHTRNTIHHADGSTEVVERPDDFAVMFGSTRMPWGWRIPLTHNGAVEVPIGQAIRDLQMSRHRERLQDGSYITLGEPSIVEARHARQGIPLTARNGKDLGILKIKAWEQQIIGREKDGQPLPIPLSSTRRQLVSAKFGKLPDLSDSTVKRSFARFRN